MAVPDRAEQIVGLRTQQVLMYESAITGYEDIFDGSKVIERITAETAVQARAIAIRLRKAGYVRAIPIVSAELTLLLAERQRKLEAGEIVQVGVNAYTGEIGLAPHPDVADLSEYAAVEPERGDSAPACVYAGRDGGDPGGVQADTRATGRNGAAGGRRRARDKQSRRRSFDDRARSPPAFEETRRFERQAGDGRDNPGARPQASARAWGEGGFHAQGFDPGNDRRAHCRDRRRRARCITGIARAA